jgi:hypothetical protein
VLIDGGPPTEPVRLENITRTVHGIVIDEALLTRPAFHPPALTTNLNDDSGRSRVEYWMSEIFSELSASWPQLRFDVKFTLRDELLVSFVMNVDVNVTTLSGPLLKYMNNLGRVGLAAQFRLKRRGDRWNVFETELPEGSTVVVSILMFAFYAPWVKIGQLNVHKSIAAAQRVQAKQNKLAANDRKKLENL